MENEIQTPDGEDLTATEMAQVNKAQEEYNKLTEEQKQEKFVPILEDAEKELESEISEDFDSYFDDGYLGTDAIKHVHDKYAREYIEKIVSAYITNPECINVNKEFLAEFIKSYNEGNNDERMRINILSTLNQIKNLRAKIESDEIYANQSKKVVEKLSKFINIE